jgi:hypothetical protein
MNGILSDLVGEASNFSLPARKPRSHTIAVLGKSKRLVRLLILGPCSGNWPDLPLLIGLQRALLTALKHELSTFLTHRHEYQRDLLGRFFTLSLGTESALIAKHTHGFALSIYEQNSFIMNISQVEEKLALIKMSFVLEFN